MSETTTWTVSRITEWVNAVITETLGGEIWVEGEISNLQRSNAGHVYFTLIERHPDGRSQPAALAVTLFDWYRQNVNRHLRRTGGAVRISDGVRVRIRGSLELYGAKSQLQLRMTGIDPVFTLGDLAAERARLLAALEADGLLHANRAVPLHPVPLRIALVTSIGSAAHADALHELERGGVGFDLVVVDARVQGVDAPQSIVAALSTAVGLGVDLVALVRGGGARTDLAAFDHELVARAVAGSPVPVWTGLGHETDRSVADDVAHTAWKTPTACAAAIVDRATEGADRVEATWDALLDAATVAVTRADSRLDRLGSRVARTALSDLDLARSRVLAAAHGARRLADGHLVRHDERLAVAARVVATVGPRRVADEQRRIDAVAGIVRAYDPAASLARGWSITRTADGRVARAADLVDGTRLVTTLADGVVDSVTVTGP